MTMAELRSREGRREEEKGGGREGERERGISTEPPELALALTTSTSFYWPKKATGEPKFKEWGTDSTF